MNGLFPLAPSLHSYLGKLLIVEVPLPSTPVRWITIAVACLILTACGGGTSDATGPGGTSRNTISYSIQVTNSPGATSVRVGEIAEASMSWQFTTTENTVPTPYVVRSSDTEVVVTNASGSTLPSVVVNNDLNYECKTIGPIEIQLTVIVGNGSSTVSWPISCTGQTIAAEPIDASIGSVGVGTHTSWNWFYQSVGEDPRELEYTVTSTDESVSIDPMAGSSLPDTDLQVSLTYVCERAGDVEVELLISVGTAQEVFLWEILCTEESIVIATQPELVTSSIGEEANGEVTWHFLSTGEEPREFSYAVTALDEDLTITDGTGVSLPDATITQELSFQCETVGRFDIGLVISVGSAQDTIDWSVECTRESVMVDLAPAFVSVSIGEVAGSEFKWQVSTTSEEPRSFDFVIRPENTSLLVGTSEGQIEPGEVITTGIEFRCVEATQLTLLVSIDVGSERHKLAWTFECTEEMIEFVANPLPMTVVQVGEVASSELRWTLESTATVEREFMYSVIADQSASQIGNATGITVQGVSVSHKVTYACDEGQQIDVLIQITIGMTQTTVSWQVVCVRDAIAIVSSPSPLQILVGETAVSEFSWQFESSYSERQVSYEVASQSATLQIDPSEGIVSAGEVIDSNLSFTCTSRRSVRVDVHISAGGASRNLAWQIDCLGEDLTRFVATIYQGPRIATIEFEFEQDTWQYSVIPESGIPGSIQFRTNRQVFVDIRTEHDELHALPLVVQYVTGERIHAVNQLGETETHVNSVESASRYWSRLLFDIDAEVFSSRGEFQILIDPAMRYPEAREDNNVVGFAFDTHNTEQLPSMHLTFVPIRTRDGLPDLSKLELYTRPIYELMPVGEIETTLSAELNLSDLSWSPSTGRQVLDRLYEFYLIHGDRNTFFQGIVRQPGNQRVILCGNAFIGSNVSITGETTQECSDNTGAHEIGHGFNLHHAPACGAELANPDLRYPYPAGNIGNESGWLMKQLRFVDGVERGKSVNRDYRYYDVMSYCPETFVSRYSYGKALTDIRRKFGVQAARRIEQPIASGFGWVQDLSVVVTGSMSEDQRWEIRNITLAALSAHRFYADATDFLVQVIHTPSGTVLHREFVRTLSVAHGEDDEALWGVRIPFFGADGLELVVFDRLGRVVLEHDLTVDLQTLVH